MPRQFSSWRQTILAAGVKIAAYENTCFTVQIKTRH